VNTNVEQVDANTFVLGVDHAESVNHIVVFLTGQIPFTDGFGGSIYFGWPSQESGGISWQFLGYISNEKPSAIFKLAKVKPSEMAVNPFSQQMMQNLVRATSAQVGISVEPLVEVQQRTALLDTEASKVTSFIEFSQKMLENFFNYASSFAVVPGLAVMDTTATYVPIDVLQKWYVNFERRLQNNPDFWKTM